MSSDAKAKGGGAPGLLVLVAGPSGAGKDTLIGEARRAFAGDARYVFPRRIVTRAASAWEEHDTVSPEVFEAARAAGRYLADWRAHGLCYALPGSIEADLAAGRIAVCNVSRGVIGALRASCSRVRVVLVEAEPEVLEARLAARGREHDLSSRRGTAHMIVSADDRIDNSGALQPAAEAFVAVLRRYKDA